MSLNYWEDIPLANHRGNNHRQGHGSCGCSNYYSDWGPVDPKDIKALREGRACVGGYVSKAAHDEEMRIRKTASVAVL